MHYQFQCPSFLFIILAWMVFSQAGPPPSASGRGRWSQRLDCSTSSQSSNRTPTGSICASNLIGSEQGSSDEVETSSGTMANGCRRNVDLDIERCRNSVDEAREKIASFGLTSVYEVFFALLEARLSMIEDALRGEGREGRPGGGPAAAGEAVSQPRAADGVRILKDFLLMLSWRSRVGMLADRELHSLRRAVFSAAHLLIKYRLVRPDAVQGMLKKDGLVARLLWRCRTVHRELYPPASRIQTDGCLFDQFWRDIHPMIAPTELERARISEEKRAVERIIIEAQLDAQARKDRKRSLEETEPASHVLLNLLREG